MIEYKTFKLFFYSRIFHPPKKEYYLSITYYVPDSIDLI